MDRQTALDLDRADPLANFPAQFSVKHSKYHSGIRFLPHGYGLEALFHATLLNPLLSAKISNVRWTLFGE
jgi:hypothetical protein